ncbi:MAG: segregation/condensation protein A [Dehalococcoidia bacterium]|nr:segregation/condensation protein A [Dehalococcoidia bacterium]
MIDSETHHNQNSQNSVETENLFLIDSAEYSGPLQALLEIVEHHELDINIVSLASVASQFAEYVSQVKNKGEISVEQISQYVLIASRLLLLKSRSLLPEIAQIEEEEEAPDILALIDALKEYRKFAQAADILSAKEGSISYPRSPKSIINSSELEIPTGLDGITLQSLVEIIGDVLERLPEDEDYLELEREPIILADRINRIKQLFDDPMKSKISFRSIIESASTRAEVIVDFLAVLELIKSQTIAAGQSERFGEIYLERLSI